MSTGPGKPTDLRAYRRQTERNLVVAVVVVLVVVGSVLIGLVYGWPAVVTGLAFLVPGATVIVLLWLFLTSVERLTNDNHSPR
jgi:hypothetical protein